MTSLRQEDRHVSLGPDTWRLVAIVAAVATLSWAAFAAIEAITVDGPLGVGDRVLLAFEQTGVLVASLVLATVLAALAGGDADRDRGLAFAMVWSALVAFLLSAAAAYAAWRYVTIHVDAGNVNETVRITSTTHFTFWQRLGGVLRAASSLALAVLALALAWPTVRRAFTNDDIAD